jgi:hypothetical protein
MSTKQPSYGTPDREYAMRLATTPPDEDGPILMVNLMKYRERAVYDDGTDGGATGKDADDRYAPIDVLTDIGAQVSLFADVDTQLLGDHPHWDRVGCVLYPTRRAFIEMQSRRDFQERHVHKEAGMDSTIVMACLPIVAPGQGDQLAGASWDEVEHPPTPDDGPVIVMHVIRFADDSGDASAMDGYHEAAFPVAARHGARIAGWYGVEGTIVGDGRTWHQVRFNEFPSRAAFMAVATDPARLAAQRAHREPAIADTYALILRPTINQLTAAR